MWNAELQKTCKLTCGLCDSGRDSGLSDARSVAAEPGSNPTTSFMAATSVTPTQGAAETPEFFYDRMGRRTDKRGNLLN